MNTDVGEINEAGEEMQKIKRFMGFGGKERI
jgi:hypothetical protein